MIKTALTAFAAAGLALAVPAAAQQVVPVTFAKGKSAATLTGSIKGDQDRSYTIDARAGQTLTVTLKATKGSAEMNVWAPGNDTALSVGAADPYKFTGVLPTTGRYKVQVYQMRASARRGETTSYTLTVAVTGGGAAPHASHDALVPGTRYNATADISCVTAAGAKPGACKAGVIRKGGGNATIELKAPDGGQRSITFTNGKASGSDAATPITATKAGDVTTVRIGSVEVYYIPDAFVVGG
ncbi:MAG TPA: hypothetical protein PK808_01430 [Polymorphobacter sp.]|nr:hypothetical protein [Polymorphobacter sp.]